jgi:peptide/nickel transport system permease protein
VASRLVQAVVVLWAAYTATFLLLYWLPGDSVTSILAGEGGSTAGGSIPQSAVDALRGEYGLDKSLPAQYLFLLGKAVRLNFGTSVTLNQPVTHLILQNMSPTLTLAACALVLAVALGTLLAFFATYVQHPWLRTFLSRLPAAGVALPGFFVGLLLVQVFAFDLKLFPASGSGTFSQLVLPALTMAMPTTALVAQVLIKGMDSVLREPYVTTARAKGLSDLRVHAVHVFKNASLPALTLVGMLVGATVTGAIVTETVFSRQGIGQLVQRAVANQDIPLVQGIVVFSAGAFVLVNLLIDLFYPLLDPRLRREGSL